MAQRSAKRKQTLSSLGKISQGKVMAAAVPLIGGGILDAAMHGGTWGMVFTGIAAFISVRHSDDLVDMARIFVPGSEATMAQTSHVLDAVLADAPLHPDQRVGSKFKRLIGIQTPLPTQPKEVQEDEQVPPSDPLVQPLPRIAPTYRARHSEREVLLSPRLGLDIDEVIEAGLFVAGMKGSGKSTLAARVMEQIGRFPLPQIIYDIKGDFTSLVDSHFQNGLIMTQEQQYDAYTIYQCRLQVVVDLRTWDAMEDRAQVIADLNTSLLKYAMTVPEEERIPWFVHLDEAEQYVSQQRPAGIEQITWQAVTQSQMNLGILGRAYGAVPCLYTQRIARIHKDVISQPELRVFMKASLDNDLERYEEYINTKEISRTDIQAFRAGDAVVILPDGRQLLAHFLDRESRHGSHTPHLEQALRVQPTYVHPVPRVVQEELPSVESPTQAMPMREQIAQYNHSFAHPTSQLSPELQRALRAWRNGNSSVTKLEKALEITHHQAYKLWRQLHEHRLV